VAQSLETKPHKSPEFGCNFFQIFLNALMFELNHTIYAFDKFQIDTRKRLLLCDGQQVQLKPKAFDLLVALIESGGRDISKDELMERVWENQFVEEANLTVTISYLRKILGDKTGENRFIVTIPGRGYRFIGELQQPPDEFILEEHTISQIVIEEESDDSNKKTIYLPSANNGLDLHRENEFAFNSSSTAVLETNIVEQNSISQSRFVVLIGACALILLLAGGFMLWRYKLAQKSSVEIPFSDATIKQLTTKGRIGNAVISPDGKFYAYTFAERDEYKNSLWLGQTDGNRDIELRAPSDNLIRGIAFSPDSKTLYFSLSNSEETTGGLFKMPVLGGLAEKLSDNIHTHFAVSPDGKQIAFYRTNKRTNDSVLVTANLDGTSEREIVTRSPDKHFYSRAPAWSFDGSLIAVSAVNDNVKSSEEIFIVRASDGYVEQLTKHEWIRIFNLAWRHDGQGLIIVATDKSETLRHLWHIDYPDGNTQRLSQDTDSYGSALSMSSDRNSLMAVQIRRESNIWVAPSDDLSKARQITFSSINGIYGWYGLDWTSDNRIVFIAGLERTLAIHSITADGGNMRQITSKGFFDQRPQVTNDGRYIIFQSNRSGANEIWRVSSDGNDLKQLTTGGGNAEPYLTPDNKRVIYTQTRKGRNFIWRVSIDGGETIQITDKESSNPGVSPDGKFIACSYKADDTAPTQLAIINLENGKPVKLFGVPRTVNFNDGIRFTPDGKAICYRDWANGIWKQDIKGKEPERLKGLPEEKIYNFDWSQDGKFFAFTRGREITDAVLIVEALHKVRM